MMNFVHMEQDTVLVIQDDLRLTLDALVYLYDGIFKNGLDVALYSTKGGFFNDEKPNCGLFLAKGIVFRTIAITKVEGGCGVCTWILKAKAHGFKVGYLTDACLEQVKPITMQ